jgi:hypothetical protein
MDHAMKIMAGTVSTNLDSVNHNPRLDSSMATMGNLMTAQELIMMLILRIDAPF